MKPFIVHISVSLLLIAALACESRDTTMWELKCAACHDGGTRLNGKVVKDREQLQSQYVTVGDFVNACDMAPKCMDILKHDKDLMRDVGVEIGLEEGEER